MSRLVASVLVLAVGILVAATVPVTASPATPGTHAGAGTGSAVTFTLGLVRRQEALERYLDRQAGTRSAGSHLSVEQIARRFGARPGVIRKVTRHLRERGASVRLDATRAFLTARLPHASAGGVIWQSATASAADSRRPLAAPLKGLVTTVLGGRPAVSDRSLAGISNGTPQPLPTRSGSAKGCEAGRASRGFLPNQYREAYGLSELHKAGLRGQGQRVAVVEIGGFARSDIKTFADCFGLKLPKFRNVTVGIPKPLPPDDETTLDLEVLIAAAPKLRAIDIYQSTAALYALPQLFAAPLNQPSHLRPSVISSSLGICEIGFNQPRGVLRLLNHVMMGAAAIGITVASATGDYGSSDCANEGLPPSLANVNVPASLPYVTAVGGTAFTLRDDNSIATERVWNDTRYGGDGGGGGGTSLYFEIPSWQRGPGIKGGYRMVPDISFLADPAPGYAIYCTAQSCDDGWMSIGGTSAATPLFAAGIALVNQLAARRGLNPMGWVNPLLYRLARRAGGSKRPIFRDVRVGDNDIFGIGCCKARPDYDRATGLGSLNFAAFAQAAVAFRSQR